MKYIKELNVEKKKVILRLDLNVPIKNGIVLDDTKLRKSIPTIEYLLNKNAKVLIMSHLGKIKNDEDKKKNSLAIVAKRLEDIMKYRVYFVEETRGKKLEEALDKHNLVFMENTRFEDYPEKKESSNNKELAKYWSTLGDIFINDAFGTTHRKHASNYGIADYLPSAYGFLIHEELEHLKPIITDIKKPYTVIMGGAKVDDKIGLIEALLKECDYLLVGGGIANTFLKAQGYDIGSSLYSKEYVEPMRNLIKQYQEKILIPTDVVTKGKETRTCEISKVKKEEKIYDIGPKTIMEYQKILNISKTIFVNGTMGLYEEAEFSNGTQKIYEILSQKKDGTIIAGGGDAVASINKLGYEFAFSYLSTGGGATLDYIANKKIKSFKER